MRKLSKFLLNLFTAIALVCCACFFVGCEPSEPAPQPEVDGYKFTVLYPDDTPVEGARVQLCVPGDGGVCLTPVSTNAEGKAVIPVETQQVYEIHLVIVYGTDRVSIGGAASNYTFDNTSMRTEATYGEYTLRLVASE